MSRYFRFALVMVAVLVSATLWASCAFDSKGGGSDGSSDGGMDGSVPTDGGTSEVVWPVAPSNWNPDAKKTPYATHLTFQRDPSAAMTVQWHTQFMSKLALVPKVWAVKASEAKVNGDNIEMPFATQYTWSGKGINYTDSDKQVQWTVELTGLEPNTKYYYRAGTWDSFDFNTKTFTNPNIGPVHSFITGIPKGSAQAFTMILAGDSRGGTEQIKANIKRLKGIGADFWLFNGDMTNAGSQTEWDAWFESMQPLMDDTPVMPVQGNHELVAELFYDQFAFPAMEGLPAELKGYAWSFNYGTVHFVGLNSNTDDLVTSQMSWLDSDLKAARADSGIKFIIVMFHHPAYSASPSHGSTQRVIDNWVPIFEKYNVDLTFSGHDHDYERSVPIRSSQKVDPGTGVVHLVAGSFFAPPYSNGNDWWTQVSVNGNVGNYVVLEANNNKLTFTAYSGDGSSVIDTFSFTK